MTNARWTTSPVERSDHHRHSLIRAWLLIPSFTHSDLVPHSVIRSFIDWQPVCESIRHRARRTAHYAPRIDRPRRDSLAGVSGLG